MAANQGQSGQDDVYIDNAHTVGDFQVIMHRMVALIDRTSQELERTSHGAEQQLAQLRTDLRAMAQAPQAQARAETRLDLIDLKTMSPAAFSGDRGENFKEWAKKVKAFTNAKLTGFRRALESVEQLPRDTPVDSSVLDGWNWSDSTVADSKLHDMLMLITGGEAQGIVESVPGRGFEAWRLISERFNSTGEMYTFDKMNSIMKQSPVKHISTMPAAIAKFEKDLKVFRERTSTEFPDILKLPILIQMIPTKWTQHFEAQFRMPGVVKSYESLTKQLINLGNEERYNERRGPDAMECDALEKEEREKTAGETEPAGGYTDRDWDDWANKRTEELDERKRALQDLELEVDWLGKSGKGKGKGKGSWAARGKGWQSDRQPTGGPQDMSTVECTWCHKKGHFRKDCTELQKYKDGRDAERAKNGDHSPYVPPQRGQAQKRPLRGAGSLDEEYDEVIGLTGDCDALDEDTSSVGKPPESEYVQVVGDDEDDDGDDWALMCGECSPGATSSDSVIPSPKSDRAWTAVSKSTPMADLFIQAAPVTGSPSVKSQEIEPMKTADGQHFYKYHWDVIADTSDYETLTGEEETTAKAGSAVGSALRTDETAVSRSKSIDAIWQGSMSKPVQRWPTRRRSSWTCGATQNTAGIWTREQESQTEDSMQQSASEDKVVTPDIPSEDGDCHLDDADIHLTAGEIRARKLQNATPDEEGFFECNPDEVDISSAEARERRFRIRKGITADSGAGDPVFPRRMINAKKIRSSPGSRRGLHYVSATDHKIPNVGEVDLEFMTEEGHEDKIVFQIADVNKPLMSISDRVDNRCRVVFDQDEQTGEDLTHIFNKRTRQKTKLKRVGKVWVLDCSVTEDFLAENSSVFSRRGH